jgi:hypothetical protein
MPDLQRQDRLVRLCIFRGVGKVSLTGIFRTFGLFDTAVTGSLGQLVVRFSRLTAVRCSRTMCFSDIAQIVGS